MLIKNFKHKNSFLKSTRAISLRKKGEPTSNAKIRGLGDPHKRVLSYSATKERSEETEKKTLKLQKNGKNGENNDQMKTQHIFSGWEKYKSAELVSAAH